ncbi:cysteine synthase [Mycena olivaceomarginata]|nr:cysteine synthase [Mycena olivaceomarginata]
MNVFEGENSLLDFYNPELGPPIPLVELPSRLNPFRQDGVRIYAKLMSHVPAEEAQITSETHTLVEYSSGSTITSIGLIANILGIPKVKAYVTNKTTVVKLQLLRFFVSFDSPANETLFGGPVHPVHEDPNGGIFVAAQEGREEPGVVNPDQYFNPNNYEAHSRWTGPQIFAQLPGIKGCRLMTVEGTLTGTGLYLKKVTSVVSIGVATAPEDRVPGPRSLNVLRDIEFPWKEAHDVVEELSRMGILAGPSSGLTLVGLFNFLTKRKAGGTLDELRNAGGEIPCVFICADQPFQYIGDYFKKLPPSHFCPVTNEELFTSDSYPFVFLLSQRVQNLMAIRYNMDWEVTSEKGQHILESNGGLPVCILDLRNADDFNASHIAGSLNVDVGARDLPNPYKHAPTLAQLWRQLDERLSANDTKGAQF